MTTEAEAKPGQEAPTPQEEMVPKRDLDGLRASLERAAAEEKREWQKRVADLEDQLTLLQEQVPEKQDAEMVSRIASRRQALERQRWEEERKASTLALKRRELALDYRDFGLKAEELEGESELALENAALRHVLAALAKRSAAEPQPKPGAVPSSELNRTPSSPSAEDTSRLSPQEKMRVGGQQLAQRFMKNLIQT